MEGRDDAAGRSQGRGRWWGASALALLVVLPLLVMVPERASPAPTTHLPEGEARDLSQDRRPAGGERAGDAAAGPADARRVIRAVRITEAPPPVDGRLDHPQWSGAPVADDFIQHNPDEGDPSSQPTEARVLYDDEALYVGIRAFDSAPDSIVARLARRGVQTDSDMVWVAVDSYHDRRTAFIFGVNPAGVKFDLYLFDDTDEDDSWQAVWDVATRIDEEGWTATFRIPLSQLRFSGADVQTWGINFARDLARRSERSFWSPIPRQESGFVSRFGSLTGIRDLSPPRRVELQPYSLARAARAPGDPADPFHSATDMAGDLGLDLRYGVTTDLTLDLTVNPDFGQVEADPGQLNLTAFETFFPERRPFFVEGSGIFRFGLAVGDGDDANESLFYSRRIGRQPQGNGRASGLWVDAPSQTRILAAGKLSGKTAGGWSLGLLNATTAEERARVSHGEGPVERLTVEPRTNYSVLRVQRDLRDGESAVGTIGTATLRDGSAADRLAIHRGAYTGGLDFRHRFGGGDYEARGFLLGSRVEGSREAVERTQLSPARYFQRPDADHLELDRDRTSLEGWAGTAEIWKRGGGFWRWATAVQARSPGFEPNDLGYMREADFIQTVGFVGYHHSQATERFRNWNLNLNMWRRTDFGGTRTGLGGNVNGYAQLQNTWGGYFGLNRQAGAYSPTLLRGGPLFLQEGGWNGWFGMHSDRRRPVHLEWNNNWSHRPESGSWSAWTRPSVRWRPSERATLRVGPTFQRAVNDRQWVTRLVEPGTAGEGGAEHYVLARLDQRLFSVVGRMDLALTPDLSLQVHAEPFVAAGQFLDFRRVANPRAREYRDRLEGLDYAREDGRIRADLTGDGTWEEWGDPDFTSRRFRSNAVLRWEYRPGSTLFLVWSQARDHADATGGFHPGRDVDRLFGAPAENIFMVKVSYWFNP